MAIYKIPHVKIVGSFFFSVNVKALLILQDFYLSMIDFHTRYVDFPKPLDAHFSQTYPQYCEWKHFSSVGMGIRVKGVVHHWFMGVNLIRSSNFY